ETQLKANAKLKDFSRIPRSRSPHSGRRKWFAAAIVLLFPVIALAVTELAGVTHLFRGQPTVDSNEASSVPTPDLLSTQGAPDTDGWVQLFNGKDLTGWKSHPQQPGNWRVEEGLLIGSGPGRVSHLFSERDDYENFHLRAEARINFRGKSGVHFGNSGIYFR